MNLALAGAGFMLGLAGAPHCAAMCGAACLGVARAAGGGVPAMVALQGGRLLSYSAAGAVAGGGAALLASFSTQTALLRPAWVALQTAALLLGLWLLLMGRQPDWLARIGSAAFAGAAVQPLRRMPPTAAAAAAGGLWVLLPCGLLQSGLLVSALGGGPLEGAALMGLFAIGSSVGLWVGPALWGRFAPRAPRARAWLVRAAGLLLASAAAWSIGRLVAGPALDAWFCL